MRTAIVSDLHLGSAAGEDLLRDPAIRRALLEEIADADRLVLLGDALELRDLPLGTALELARPFFEDLGKTLSGREVILVPGNHDHRFAEAVVDDPTAHTGDELGLEQWSRHQGELTAVAQDWLGPARLRIAYPGLWLRRDVYATHGHYMDVHLSLPRLECVAAAAMSRVVDAIPATATPTDYERVLRPIYGLGFALAQSRGATKPRSNRSASETVWQILSPGNDQSEQRHRLAGPLVRTGFPAAVWTLNRLFGANFEADVSPAAIFASGVRGASEMASRLGLSQVNVIVGHTHRGGPYDGEGPWNLPDGGQIYNTGSWFFAQAFHRPGAPPSDYWPGTVTWVEDDGPPRPVRLLMDRSHAELAATVSRASRR